jgi:hypothetical protein
MFWRRRKEVCDEHRNRLRTEGWNACLDAVEEFLAQHSWVSEEDEPNEIFCDGCGASLSKKLKSMRKQGPTGR